MKNLLAKINKLHVNHEVLAAGVLHLNPSEQNKVNNLIMNEVLRMPEAATPADLVQKRQKMVDDVNDYGVILDVFEMLKIVTNELENTLDGSDNGPTESYDALGAATMLIKSVEDGK